MLIQQPLESEAAQPPILTKNTPGTPGTPYPTSATPELELLGSQLTTPDPTVIAQLADKPTQALLFLNGSALMYWDPTLQTAETLAEQVSAYSTNTDNRHVYLLRDKNIVANGSQVFDVSELDSRTRTSRTLLANTSELRQLQVSPDGRWIALMDARLEGSIYSLQVRSLGTPIKLGECVGKLDFHCSQLSWSDDSREILWADADGLWASRNGQAGKLVAPGIVSSKDPQGELSAMQVSYQPKVWSPDGRFAWVDVIPSNSKTHWLAVIDTRTGRYSEIPGTFESLPSKETNIAQINWLRDGRLSVIHTDLTKSERFPSIQVYRVIPTNDNMLVLDEAWSPFSDSSLAAYTDHPGIHYVPRWSLQSDTRTISFGIIPSEPDLPPLLVEVNLDTRALIVLRALPQDTITVLWSPDGQQLLVLGNHDQLFLTDRIGNNTINLQPFIGQGAHTFTWIDPLPNP